MREEALDDVLLARSVLGWSGSAILGAPDLSGLADAQVGDRRLVGVRDAQQPTSPRGRPISCMPIGNPRASKPTGTLIAGSPANVA